MSDNHNNSCLSAGGIQTPTLQTLKRCIVGQKSPLPHARQSATQAPSAPYKLPPEGTADTAALRTLDYCQLCPHENSQGQSGLDQCGVSSALQTGAAAPPTQHPLPRRSTRTAHVPVESSTCPCVTCPDRAQPRHSGFVRTVSTVSTVSLGWPERIERTAQEDGSMALHGSSTGFGRHNGRADRTVLARLAPQIGVCLLQLLQLAPHARAVSSLPGCMCVCAMLPRAAPRRLLACCVLPAGLLPVWDATTTLPDRGRSPCLLAPCSTPHGCGDAHLPCHALPCDVVHSCAHAMWVQY